MPLKLSYDELLSKIAFNLNMRRYTTAAFCDNRNNAYNPLGEDEDGRNLPIEVRVNPGATSAVDSTAEGLDLLEGGLINQVGRCRLTP